MKNLYISVEQWSQIVLQKQYTYRNANLNDKLLQFNYTAINRVDYD